MNAYITSPPPLPGAAAGWAAALRLGFARRGARTVLAERAHLGPLRVQRPLYPEGDSVCHAILLHPPAGLVGGDRLNIEVTVGEGAHALLTTPGAGKWYRSAGPWASMAQRITVAAGAVCEWLPQESIVFDGALGDLSTEVALAGDACFIGAEMLCFGRSGAGERFLRGELAMRTRIERDGRALWLERGIVGGDAPLLRSAVGLHGAPVGASLLVASPACDAALRDAWREEVPEAGEGAVTLLPGLLVARWIGPGCEPGREWFARLWRRARPRVAGREAQLPRIWRT